MSVKANFLHEAGVAPFSLVGTLRRIVGQRVVVVTVLLVGLFAWFSISQDGFLTQPNIESMLTGASILWVTSIGLTFVMLAGGLDLSVGSMLALSGIALGTFYIDLGVPAGVAIVLVLLLGLALGGLGNGFLVGAAGLPFLVVTLGTLILYRGVVNLWSGSRTDQVDSALLEDIAFGRIAGLPTSVWLMVITLAVGLYVQRWTYFGRDIYALGNNPEAARLSGLRVVRTVMAVYAIAGMLAALGGIIQVGRIGAASPLMGDFLIFDATAAVLLGGTSMRGGVGGVGGTAIGVLLLATLQNGLAVSGLEPAWQQVVTGGLLVVALGLDQIARVGADAARRRLGVRRAPDSRSR